MRKFLSVSLASVAVIAAGSAAGAADLGAPYVKAPPMMPPAFSWTGCYIGGQSGEGTGHTKWQDVNVPGDIDTLGQGRTATTDQSGAVYGGQVGCDYQFGAFPLLGGPIVLGLQGQFSGSTVASTEIDQFNATWSLRNQIDWYASVTGRAGVALDRFLPYVKGGVAWDHNKIDIENSGFTLGTPSLTRTGWTVGSGLEWAFAPSWSIFIETDYFDFSGQNTALPGNAGIGNGPFSINTKQTFETFTIGMNWRFGGR
jgi:outer membrane immunogenic protein